MNRIVKKGLWCLLLLVGLGVLWATVWIGPMVYRSMVGLKRYETVAPVLPENLGSSAILVFSKTNGFRDDEQIQAANRALREIAQRRGWATFVTENAAVFNPRQLRQFRAVVWNSVSGDVLTENQRQSFKTWLEQGGGFVGLHGAGGDPAYKWRWYVDELIGARFIGHTLNPQIQQARLVIDDMGHPATRDLGSEWVRADEWYSFASSPREKGYRILVSIDEQSYQPVDRLIPFSEPKDIRMGRDHPMVWSHCVGNGRALYSALGHLASSYSEEKYRLLIAGAISWAGGFEGQACTGNIETSGTAGKQ